MPRFDPRTEGVIRGVSVAVVAACALVLAVTVSVAAIPGARRWFDRAPTGKPGYAVGETLGFRTEVGAPAAASIVVFFRADCPACQRSKDELKTIVTAAGTGSVNVVLVTSPGDRAASIRYAADIGLNESNLSEQDFGPLPLRVVPTVTVVDRTGVIRFVRQGELETGTPADVLSVASSIGVQAEAH